MSLKSSSTYADGCYWRCRSKNPGHDIKVNIRFGSVFEQFNISLQILYFLSFYCFTENKSLSQTLIESKNFAKELEISPPTIDTIIKFNQIIKRKIEIQMHNYWKNKPLDIEVSEDGYTSIEIDESEIIGNINIIYWIFGIVDRNTKEVRIFCELNDRSKNNLVPIICKNVNTNIDEDMQIDDIQK